MGKKILRSGKKGPTVTDGDREDSASLQQSIEIANRRNEREGLDRISDAALARFSAPLGGAKHPQQWMNYRRGTRHIPPRDKLVLALRLHRLPETVFPSWEKSILPLLVQVFTFASHMNISNAGLVCLGELLTELGRAPDDQRAALMQKIKELLES